MLVNYNNTDFVYTFESFVKQLNLPYNFVDFRAYSMARKTQVNNYTKYSLCLVNSSDALKNKNKIKPTVENFLQSEICKMRL